MTTIDDTNREASTAPPLKWVMPDCPICSVQVRPIVDGLGLRCDACGVWWTRDGNIGRSPSTVCGQQATDSELSCIRREGHGGDHAAYDQLGTGAKVVRWRPSSLEQVRDALRKRHALEMSSIDFETVVENLLESEGVR